MSKPIDPLAPARYKSAFEQGLEAANAGVPWTRCPYTAQTEQYERSEWLRGHQAKEVFR